MRLHHILLLSVATFLLFVSLEATPSQLSYTKGQEFVFSLNSQVDGRGRNVATNDRTSGSYATMASTVVTKCTDEDATSYLFVMNMFGTTVDVGQSLIDEAYKAPAQPSSSQLQASFDAIYGQLKDNSALGADMYFQQAKTGEITQIWYQKGDSTYFVNVKLGAINAFQTKVVQPGQTQKILENDPVGTHYAFVTGKAQSSLYGGASNGLVINKIFNQTDVTLFPDPNLKPGNVQIAALTTTGIHEEGYIHSSNVAQTVNLVDARSNPGGTLYPQSSQDNKMKLNDAKTLGFDMQLSSKGALAISLTSFALRSSNSFFTNPMDFSAIRGATKNMEVYQSSMFELSAQAATFLLLEEPVEFDDGTSAEQVFANLFQSPVSLIDDSMSAAGKLRLMDKFAKFIRQNPNGQHLAALQDMLLNGGTNDDSSVEDQFPAIRERILYVLVKAEEVNSLIKFGMHSNNRDTRFRTLFSVGAAGLHRPTIQLVLALRAMASDMKSIDAELRNAALLSLGAVASRLPDADLRAKVGADLLKRVASLLQEGGKSASSIEELTVAIDSIGNAGPNVIAVETIGELSILTHSHHMVRLSAVRALRKYLSAQDHEQQHLNANANDFVRLHAALLVRSRVNPVEESDDVVRRTAKSLLDRRFPIDEILGASCMFDNGDSQQLVENSDFPFNKSFTTGFSVGGSVANASFAAQLFAGTNFDCTHQYFNYKGLAEATVNVALFDWSKEAVEAQAVYGRENGAPLADRLYLRVWDDVLYDKPIPSLDCKEHTYPIAHASPGFSVSYTVWVSVIPIVFSASATLNLNLDWGWSICDGTLSAMIELIPGATLTIAGDVEVNVLILRAGLELEGSFNTEIRPQASIQGSLCKLEFDVRQTSTPMTADFNAYYVWKHCKLWIFDCKWGKHNEKILWSWNSPAVDKVLYEKDWPIHI